MTIFKTTNFLDATSSIQTQINNKQNLDVLITLNVNVSSVSITPVDTGLNVNLVAGKKYKLSFFGNHQTVALTTGVRIGFIAPTGTYNVIGTLKGIVNLGTANTELHTSIHSINTSSATAGSFILTTSVGAANTPSYIGGDLYIECITSGQIRLQIATEVNASSAQLNAGSTIILKQLN